MQKDKLAKALARCGLKGSPFTEYGIDPTWKDAEAIVHDVAHLVVLGSRIDGQSILESEVHWKLMELPRFARLENERMTLAVEIMFLRKQDAFLRRVEPPLHHAGHAMIDGEKRWLREVTSSANLTMVSVRRHLDTDEAKMYLRRLEHRLQYHARKGTPEKWTRPRL